MNVNLALTAQIEILTLQEVIANYPDLLTPYLHYLKKIDQAAYHQALAYLQTSTPESSRIHNSQLPGAAQETDA